MASPDKVYREFFRRTHRTMAAYLAMVAWTRDLDCLAIDRDEIMRFLGLTKRVENQRLEWLKSDIKDFFPYVEALWYSTTTKKFRSLFLSRRKFPANEFVDSTLPDRKRAQALTAKGLRTEVLSIPNEEEMLTELTGAIHGLLRPKFGTMAKTFFDG